MSTVSVNYKCLTEGNLCVDRFSEFHPLGIEEKYFFFFLLPAREPPIEIGGWGLKKIAVKLA